MALSHFDIKFWVQYFVLTCDLHTIIQSPALICLEARKVQSNHLVKRSYNENILHFLSAIYFLTITNMNITVVILIRGYISLQSTGKFYRNNTFA